MPRRFVFVGGRFLAILALSLVWGPQSAPGQDTRDAVVKIYNSTRTPDFLRPWTKGRSSQSSGSGVIISGNRILTNAHVVQYASRLLVQANQSSQRVPARVIGLAPEIDLAVLTVDDPAWFEGRPQLEFAQGIPDVRTTLNCYGYPIGGEQLSVTEGIVSRIEFASLGVGGMGLRIQVDAAINPGNSGGPAVIDDKIVGLVFSRVGQADNIGFIIPVDEIEMFLQDVADGTYDGKPLLLDQLQTIENPALRRKLGIEGREGGMMVTNPADTPDNPLQAWDVITHVGPHELDRTGAVQIDDNLRLTFQYWIPKLMRDNRIELSIIREGKPMKLQVPLQTESNALLPLLKGTYPRHFIFGPMVFSAATQDLVSSLGPQGQTILSARKSPLVARRFDTRKSPDEELVCLGARMFAHPIAEGYDAQVFAVVERINDVEIRNLAHLVETLRDATGTYITFDLAGTYETMVFDRQELMDATEEVLEEEGIRYQYSDDLKDLWEK